MERTILDNQLKGQYPEEQFDLIFGGAKSIIQNLKEQEFSRSISCPIELGLYNDQEIVNHPFIQDIGVHEMRLANNYSTLTSEYLYNISIFMDKVLSSFIENSENPVRNKINSFTYASE